MIIKGFDSEIYDSQKVFRQILGAMANPGTVMELGSDLVVTPGELHRASGAILLSLLDFETPFWSDLESLSPEIQWVRFHTGAPVTSERRHCLFALQTDPDMLTDPARFNPGTMESPDVSTTLIVQIQNLSTDGGIRISGPGIRKASFLGVSGVSTDFLDKREFLFSYYPLGVDIIFVCHDRFVVIPRTTRMEIL